ncbi:MAG: hypothetical protein R3C14_46495 [Caldilineaceae bacterium]
MLLLGQIVRACISSEFYCFATKQSLRALCRQMQSECGGPGAGAVGICLTDGFALAPMVDESVMAPVLSQPSFWVKQVVSGRWRVASSVSPATRHLSPVIPNFPKDRNTTPQSSDLPTTEKCAVI